MDHGKTTGGKTLMSENKDERAKNFLKNYCWDDILELANEYPDNLSLPINYKIIERADRDLAKELLDHPQEVISSFEAAVKEMDLPTDIFFDKLFVP